MQPSSPDGQLGSMGNEVRKLRKGPSEMATFVVLYSRLQGQVHGYEGWDEHRYMKDLGHEDVCGRNLISSGQRLHGDLEYTGEVIHHCDWHQPEEGRFSYCKCCSVGSRDGYDTMSIP